MLYVIWAILVFGSLIGRVVLDYQEARSRKKFDQDAKMLMFIAIDACDCKGSIALPKYNSPDDGRTRTIYVSRDGKDVRAMLWAED